VEIVLAVVVIVLLLVPVAIVAYLFLWAAVKDGEHDDATQRRLRIRRRTRLGPE
jgi:nitrogen fixation-related uncharacterized protein